MRAYEGEERRRFEIEHKFFRPAQPKRSRNSYRKGKTYDCAVCWESSPCLRMNFECECILCENCLQVGQDFSLPLVWTVQWLTV